MKNIAKKSYYASQLRPMSVAMRDMMSFLSESGVNIYANGSLDYIVTRKDMDNAETHRLNRILGLFTINR